jgi:hypothetical protein
VFEKAICRLKSGLEFSGWYSRVQYGIPQVSSGGGAQMILADVRGENVGFLLEGLDRRRCKSRLDGVSTAHWRLAGYLCKSYDAAGQRKKDNSGGEKCCVVNNNIGIR